MAVVKVIEIIAQSEKGWEAAAQTAIDEAAKSVRHIKSIYIQDFQAEVEGNAIIQYRVNAKISFQVNKSSYEETEELSEYETNANN